MLGTCSVLEHLEKTSTEHFDFTEHEREHRAPNFARAPSTLIIAYNKEEGVNAFRFFLVISVRKKIVFLYCRVLQLQIRKAPNYTINYVIQGLKLNL